MVKIYAVDVHTSHSPEVGTRRPSWTNRLILIIIIMAAANQSPSLLSRGGGVFSPLTTHPPGSFSFFSSPSSLTPLCPLPGASSPPQAQVREKIRHHRPALQTTLSSMCPAVTLHTGHQMPLVGLGTWKGEKGETGRAVEAALRMGYRHIDCK
jgi:hypothetical protein